MKLRILFADKTSFQGGYVISLTRPLEFAAVCFAAGFFFFMGAWVARFLMNLF